MFELFVVDKCSAMSLLDPTSKVPLYPLIIEEIGGDNIGEDGEVAVPSFYLKDDCNDTNKNCTHHMHLTFWMEAHTLTCLKHGVFQSSVDDVYAESISTLLDDENSSNITNNLDIVKRYIADTEICNYITSDGTIINSSDNIIGGYRIIYCIGTSGLTSASDSQLETTAKIVSSALLKSKNMSSAATSNQIQTNTSSSSGRGWLHYPKAIAQKVSSGINYILGDDSGIPTANWEQQTEDLDDVTDSLKNVLANDIIPPSTLHSAEVDDNLLTRKRLEGKPTAMRDDTLSNTSQVISVAVLASTCERLLAFSQQQTAESSGDEFFTLGGSHGDVERVMLYRDGFGTCSLGSFCRQAGSHYIKDQSIASSISHAREKLKRIGKILSNVSEKEVHLIELILIQSNYAVIEKDIISIFPRGVPSDFETSEADHALFQIHVTKMTIQSRITRLEQTANVAKQNAVRAQRNKMTKLAMVHMRRRKAALEELDRCSEILANLDASELRLERAKSDVQVVQSYKLLKTALQDVRQTSGIDHETVEELFEGIREEMDEMVDLGSEAVIPDDAIDEDELNKEFLALELECKNDEEVSVDVKPQTNAEEKQLSDEGKVEQQDREQNEVPDSEVSDEAALA